MIIIKAHISIIFLSLCLVFSVSSCTAQVVPGAERTNKYSTLLKSKRVGVVANQTSLIGNQHLVDKLISKDINIVKIFSPEHGFRGAADAGEMVADGKDIKTGIPIVSLYGKHKKPTTEDMHNIDVVLFDIQDVGARFYTYISTLHYVMESCAENNIRLVVLDRPNPNAFYIDGPVLEKKHSSFVGMHPVPVVYGMTIGEYALMINGEGWLKNNVVCDLSVVKCQNWNHLSLYRLPVKPSPNLPHKDAILLYPSLCFFEGTVVSAGRGTDYPFRVFGMPGMKNTSFTFTPRSIPGASKYPKFKGRKCNGVDLRENAAETILGKRQINLDWLIFAYNNCPDKSKFFNAFFTKLAGTQKLQKQIEEGMTAKQIRQSWQKDIEAFKRIRKKYLLY